MYSQYWSDFNTVFLITILGCFLNRLRCFITLFISKRQEVARRVAGFKIGYCNTVAGAQATALMPVAKMTQKTRQDSRITAQI